MKFKSRTLPSGLALMMLTLLSSCAIYAPEDRWMTENLPEQFTLYSYQAPSTETRWWERFQSPELNALVQEALTNSPSLQQSWARLAQSEAVARQAGAARTPSLQATASAALNRVAQATTDLYSVGLAAAYEVDLWGRIRSQTEAAALDRDASREQLNTAAMTLAAQVAQTWTSLVSQRLQTELIHQQIEANETSMELVELRFKKSFANALDVYQQRQTVAAAEARIPPAELREQLLENQLSALVGRMHFHSTEFAGERLPDPSALPLIGIPADLLANRPDVRQAGLRLYAADWRVSSARADRLPAIRLTASADYRNASFDDWFANLVAGLTGPIFDGGRRKAEVERTRAVANERLAAYRETVINAIKEVEDALVSEQKQREYIMALDRNLELSRSSHQEALNRYRKGLIEYLPVLVELVSLQNLERDRVVAQQTLLIYRIDVHRALGGTWPNELNPPSFESEESS